MVSKMGHEGMEAQPIAVGPKTGNLTDRHGGNVGVVAEGLPLVDIAEVDFHKGQVDGGDRIPNANAGVGIGGGVHDNAVKFSPGILDPINQNPFMVRLASLNGHAQASRLPLQSLVDIREGDNPINPRFALAQQVEIGTVEDKN